VLPTTGAIMLATDLVDVPRRRRDRRRTGFGGWFAERLLGARPDSWRLLRPYLSRHRSALVGAGLATVAMTLAGLAAPWPLKFAIDRIIAGRSAGFVLGPDDAVLLGGVVGAVLLVAAVDAFASYRSDLALKRAGERIVHEMRVDTYAHLQRLSLAYHFNRRKGDLVARVTADVNAVGDLFSQTLGTLASAVLVLVGMFAVTVFLDPLLAAVAFLVTPLLFVVSRHYQRRITLMARAQRKKEGEIASLATEALSAMSVVKAFGTEDYEHGRVHRSSEERLTAGVEVSRVEARFAALVDVMGALATAAVLGLGVLQVAQGRISAGDLVVFVAYSGKLYKPLKDISKQASRVARATARIDRITEVLLSGQMLPDRARGPVPARAAGEVHLAEVTFGYTPGRLVLAGVDLHVPAGTRLAVVGQSGAGKSTIAALVARFYDPVEGQVFLDRTDVRKYPLSWLREQVGVLLQDTILFSGTVTENICYGLDAAPDEVRRVARLAGAEEFVDALPDGFDTLLGPGGVGLSGGQRQRIGIARVLLRDPPVLVLDEPTTGLDAENEARVVAALDTLVSGRTTILVTHSTALAATADAVAVVAGGRVAEYGSPDVLLGHDSLFRRLTLTQQTPTQQLDVLQIRRGAGL
jgi:ATP-binding cassette, subfamily B, bacterial